MEVEINETDTEAENEVSVSYLTYGSLLNFVLVQEKFIGES